MAVTTNAITQGIAVATHLQDKFDWKSVAVSAAVAPLSKYLTNSLGLTSNNLAFKAGDLDKFGASLVSGLASQRERMAVYSKGKLDYASLAGDAFGSVLGDSMAEAMKEKPVTVVGTQGPPGVLGVQGVAGKVGEEDVGLIAPNKNPVQATGPDDNYDYSRLPRSVRYIVDGPKFYDAMNGSLTFESDFNSDSQNQSRLKTKL
jgi:hypothetical protein